MCRFVRTRLLCLVAVVAVVATLASAPALSLAPRTFVSSGGSNANPCTLAMPCRSLDIALAQTSSGGEIIVLDSAGYGGLTIGKAVSIIAPDGVYAGVSVASGTGITVNAPSGVVSLQGLRINGVGGTIGIDYQGGATLRLDRVEISGFSANGTAALYTTALMPGRIYLNDVNLHDNYFSAGFGSNSASLIVAIDRSRFDNNQSGPQFGSYTIATLRDVSVRGNAAYGLVISPASGTTGELTCDGCIITDNALVGVFSGLPNGSAPHVRFRHSIVEGSNTGLETASNAKVYLSDTTITRNQTGVQPVASGENFSFGDNMLFGNGFDNGWTSISKN